MYTLNRLKATEVRAGYRLHLGFYRFYDYPYIYGSLGVAINEPYVKVVVSESNDLEVKAPTKACEDLVKDVLKVLGKDRVNVVVDGFVAHNVGLGSRTRISLATYVALTTHFNLSYNFDELLKLLGSKISGVGVYTFLYGNLAIDSGLRLGLNQGIPKLLKLMEVPSNWYVVIALPEGVRGLSEDEEKKILKEVKPFIKQSKLYREFIRLITALTLKDFSEFTQALNTIQVLTGEYFSEFQGGIFTHDITEEVVNIMVGSGAGGVGQSSWGPTAYGFVDSYPKAVSVKSAISSFAEKKGLSIRCWITNVSSLGHQVTIYGL